ncbi:hypothetical protein SEUCBS139899_000350 [Sporothrix eucalyptigena]|uniref:Uncharacterized protein n=1 Tax=Sporothrix eucalyptigena TaxID=1812306 RepID=A0ABP0BDN1_9PEZI
METPSRGSGESASSPDPLNERNNDQATMSVLSSAAQRITRSQRSNSLYSLDMRNKMHPSRFSSPRKQTFHLDVGSNVSPQKIRVTVETEDNTPDISNADDALNDIANTEQKVNRRLFTVSTPVPSLTPKTTTTSSRRRRRSPSPAKTSSTNTHGRKKVRLSTTTTKVPLRGLSDDEDTTSNTASATPKPKRGRPRRSGTPKPSKTQTIEPSSPVAATPAKVSASTTKRGRKPRAATPKAEETGQDELASVDATLALSSPIKRTPRAVRKTTPKGTPKHTGSSAFSESDAEPVTDSRPTKRGRGRPRRQAMAPDEMAAIVENELEEQHATQPDKQAQAQAQAQVQELNEQQIPTTAMRATSASPDPIMDDGNDVLDAQPFHAPTPASIHRTRVIVSPAPTSLSSVDLISVQTPARPNFDTEAAPASINHEEAVQVADEHSDGDSGDDFAYGAPSADDYFSEDIHATTSQVSHVHAAVSPDTESSPMMDVPTLTVINTELSTIEASNAPVVIDHEQHEAMVTSSPNNDLPSRIIPTSHNDHSDMIHFSSVESPLIHETSTSHSHRESRLAQSELTAADSDGDVDAVLLGSIDDMDAESEAESAVMDSATSNFRDMDTIAKGEDFSMIGMESLQASFHMSNATLPAMGETTSRIVSRTLESVRQGNQGNQEAENRDNDGLSYLDFLYESNSSTPASAPATVPKSASKTPRTPRAAPSAAPSSSHKEIESVPQSLPAPKSDSPRKKAEPLREFIARKSLHEAHGSSATPRVVTVSPRPLDLVSPETAKNDRSQVYNDSFSEIPDSVLEAAVPTITNTPFYSRHQAELTGQVAVEYVADDASVHSLESRHAGLSNLMDAAAEADGQVAHTQPETEITSSPPVHFPHTQRAVSEQAGVQRPRLAHENRTTPVGLSPRYPITGDQTDHLRVPSEGFRPSLSPIVRAGRALQSVTSDPPTPKENEGFLRSPFRSSVARDSQSPAAAHGHDASSPEPVPPVDEAPIQNLLLSEQEAVDDISVIATEQAEPDIEDTNDNVQDDVHGEEVVEEVNDVLAETTPSQQSPPATATSQRSPPSMSRAAWNMTTYPFTGIKNMFINGAQVIPPHLRFPASTSASPRSLPPSTNASGHAITPTPAARITQARPQKRTALEAHLDEEASSSAEPTLRSAKRPRMETPSGVHEMQPGSGSDTGRSWRSYIFRENGVTGSITSFAKKLVSRIPNNDGNDEESDDNIDMDSNTEATEIDNEADVAEDNMDVNAVALPEVNDPMDTRLKAPVLISEANSTQYGSDVIMSMINDISGEGKDVDAIADIESDDQVSQVPQYEQEDTGMSEDELPQMTPAIFPIPGQRQPGEEMSEPESTDDEVDIWAIEADRTTRIHAKDQAKPQAALQFTNTAQVTASTAAMSPIRDPRLARIQGSPGRRSLASSPLASSQASSSSEKREQSLLPEDKEDPDEIQGLSSAKNSLRPAGRFILDDFFSSPMTLPRQLPPTSAKNIRFNEESRQKAMEEYLEHERQREAREAAAAARKAALQRKLDSKNNMLHSSAQKSRLSYGLSSEPDASIQSDANDAVTANSSHGANPISEPALAEAPQMQEPTDEARQTTLASDIVEDEDSLERLPSSSKSSQIRTRLGPYSRIRAQRAALVALQDQPVNAPTTSAVESSIHNITPTSNVLDAAIATQPSTDDQSTEAVSRFQENRPIMTAPLPSSSPAASLIASPVMSQTEPQTELRSSAISPIASPVISLRDIPEPIVQETVVPGPSAAPKQSFTLGRPNLMHPSLVKPRSERVTSVTRFITPKKPAPPPAKLSEKQKGKLPETLPEPQSLVEPTNLQDAPDSLAVMSDREWELMLAHSKSKLATRKILFEDGDGHKPADTDRTIIDMLVNEKYANMEREIEEELRLRLAAEEQTLRLRREELLERARLREEEAARKQELTRQEEDELQRQREIAEYRSQRELDERYQNRRRLFEENVSLQQNAPSQSFIPQHTVQDQSIMNEVSNSTGWQQDNGRNISLAYVDEGSSFMDESSFLTPVLKPLPDKMASPTKSCIRPATKPKTPGRVVEFTSSTMEGPSNSHDEIMEERQDLNDANLQLAEHFGLDTSNRVPHPALNDLPAAAHNVQPLGADGDARMWDRKGVAEELAAIERHRRQNRRYEVDEEVSDMFLADTHTISAAKPYQALPKPDPKASMVGKAVFFPTDSVGHSRWQAPAAIEQLPGREWELDDWLLLNQVLQTYREAGPLNFRLHYVPSKFHHQKAPRIFSQAPEPDRPSSILLNKIVHTKHTAMLVKSWHADVVDVFMARSGYMWNEHYLMRRLFSLLLGEERRGVFN